MTLRKKVIFVVCTFVVTAVALVGCVSLTARSQTGTRDHLVGWFKIQGGDTIIPVFKIEETYYSVCWPGIKVPLKECPEKG
jgi:ABC-type phosphate transport system substrate-binding protein